MDPRARIPLAPLLLGAGGLLPFVGLAALVVAGGSRALGIGEMAAMRALVGYGAVIASFLGGIRWGVAVRDGGPHAADYLLSVLPSLLAWAASSLDGPRAAGALAVLIGLWGVVDQDLSRRGLAPAWFGRLRAGLSTGAAGALAAAALWS